MNASNVNVVRKSLNSHEMPVQAIISLSPNFLLTHFNSTSSVTTPPFKIHQQKVSSWSASSSNHNSKFAPLTNGSHPQGKVTEENLVKLRDKVESCGINWNSCIPGAYTHLKCPKCQGGPLLERSLSFHITQSGERVIWRCFNLECSWAAQISADDRDNKINLQRRIASRRILSEESLRLEPLGDELIAYFAERMISKETLEKNRVMQRADDKNVIAFPYRRDGVLVGCKYRSIEKRFWQLKRPEQMFYGLDDIKDADEIIIVEGEMDKLSMDEIGMRHCISVPNGAPQSVSCKELSIEEDAGFQFLWNGKEYIDKASRIILATDGDVPGQALAKELARRVGRERCWLVRWPKKDEFSLCKDANEVLMTLGADALREAIKNAESYHLLDAE